MVKFKYITLMEVDGFIVYKTGKRMNWYGERKVITPPSETMNSSNNYGTSTYSTTTDTWWNSDEKNDWLYEQASKWAAEIDGSVVHDWQSVDTYLPPSRPIPEPT